MKTLSYFFISSLFILAIFSVTSAQDKLVIVTQDANSRVEVDFKKQLVTVIGYGRPDPYRKLSDAEALVFAMTEARAFAYIKLAAFINGLTVDGSRTLADGRLCDDQLKIDVEALVQYAREIDHKFERSKDGSMLYSSILGIIWTGSNSLNRHLIPKLKRLAEADKAPQFSIPSSFVPPQQNMFNPNEKYTGLVIDAREIDLRPAMAPRIFAADGREVYGTIKVDSKYAIEIGVVGYTNNINDAAIRDRVGARPLVIKAQNALGPNRADVAVSDQDAGIILYADQIGDFLPQCRVVFWLR